MKKAIVVLVSLFACLVTPSSVVAAEEIGSFDASYVLNPNGTVAMSEQIHYDFGGSARHGIFRTLPLVKQNKDGNKFVVSLTNISVVDDRGSSLLFTKTTDGSTESLKIGDPNKTIVGQHAYDIRYVVSGAITYFSDHDEFYWNVTGTDWQVPIRSVRALVTLPQEVPEQDLRLACFTGEAGSSEHNCQISASGKIVSVLAQALGSSQGLTIVVGFPKGLVATVEPKPYLSFFETPFGKIALVGIIIAAIIWYIVTPAVVVYRWWKYGRDPKPALGVVTAWFDAPKTKDLRRLRPAEAGVLIDERADMSDVTATIIDLARRGYLSIIETKKNDFSLKKLSAPAHSETLLIFEKKLYDGIFSSKDVVPINDTNFFTLISDIKHAMYEQVVTDGFFPKNPQSIRTLYGALAVFAFITGNILLAIISWTFGLAMPRKTLFGAQQAAVAKSLKNFLSSQEKKLAFQAKNQMFFEKFLPYAVAFGVEKIWAERFKDIAMKPPDWYVGYRPGTFSSIYFVNSLSSSMTSFASSASPARSTSGFSSGFSGGSVGGGGGGGGGGSW